jgi:hypothetical protein
MAGCAGKVFIAGGGAEFQLGLCAHNKTGG